MRFIVSSSALLKQLQIASGVISANTVLPILEDFLFEIQGNKLTVLASDLETTVRVELDVEATDKGKICIPAKILTDTLKNLPEQPVTFSIDGNLGIEITTDNGKYKITGENPDSFPKEPVQDNSSSFELTSSQLIKAIAKTLFATSTDELRPAMNGVFFELEKKSIQFVATDAHRLVCYKLNQVKTPEKASFVVPRKPLQLLKSALPDSEDSVTLSYSDSHLFVKHDNVQLSCRLIDARFPDYKVVIPQDNPYVLTLNKHDFISALKRVSIYSNKTTHQVVLNISGSELHLTAQDPDFSFEGDERMSCQYNGADMQIGFNARFLIEMLGAVEGEEFSLELSTPTRAGIISETSEDKKEELLLLIMPLMINNI
ncbi:MAG: DNA polymerase III subunit beta [Chitinophagaceae bacterium]|nr:DNA polymerase III subunit beta [Chitinophagaceae bacterium]